MKKSILLPTLLLVATSMAARDGMPDTLNIPTPPVGNELTPPIRDSIDVAMPTATFTDKDAPILKSDPDFNTSPRFILGPAYYMTPTPYQWRTGSVFAAGWAMDNPGLMRTETGIFGIRQQIDQVSVNVFAEANKYGWFNGLDTQWGAGASVTVPVKNDIALTLYGAWYSGNMSIVQPAMLGYVNSTNIGFYVDKRLSRHWGIKAGARAYRRLTDGSWDYTPTLMPYYRFSNGAELGIDIGSILYALLRSQFGDNSYHGNSVYVPGRRPDSSHGGSTMQRALKVQTPK